MNPEPKKIGVDEPPIALTLGEVFEGFLNIINDPECSDLLLQSDTQQYILYFSQNGLFAKRLSEEGNFRVVDPAEAIIAEECVCS